MDSLKPSTSSSSKRSFSASSSDEAKESKRTKNESKPALYDGGGLKNSLHGDVYQLKLLMLYLSGAVKNELQFRLATELTAAGKLDDVFFEYINSKTGIFLQAKHKQNSDKKIYLNDLLKKSDLQSGNEFSLPKYFSSYRAIKKKAEFNSCKSKKFVICTNIDLEDDLSKHFDDAQDDTILQSFSTKCKRFQFNMDEPSTKIARIKLVSAVKMTSKCHTLATNLARCVFEGISLELIDELFGLYHVALGKHVIKRIGNDGKAKFRREFLKNETKKLNIANFRKAFYNNTYLKLKEDESFNNENKFWEEMEKKELIILPSFGIDSMLDPNPKLEHSEKLAEVIVMKIKDPKDVVTIIKNRNKENVINNNISKLAGHVFVKKGHDEKNIYHINSAFLDESYIELPYEITAFRTSLIEELEENGKKFEDLNKYKFNIPSYNNKPYRDHILPDDYFEEDEIDHFLSNLIIAVTPNETELDKIIRNDLKKKFNLINTDLQASVFLNYMLNWMKKKEGHYLTSEDGEKLLDDITKNTSLLVAIGSTLEYCHRIEDFRVKFKQHTKQLEKVLNSERRHIFNLISPGDTSLGSCEVYRALQNIDMYHQNGSYLFTCLSSLSHEQEIQKDLTAAFESETSLLVIECKNERNNIKELYNDFYLTIQNLYRTLMKSDNKKIIFITLESKPLPEKIKTLFSGNDANMEDGNCYEEIHKNGNDGKKYNVYSEEKSVNTSLAHLTENFQEELLNKKITFQGQEVELDTVIIDEVSKKLFQAEVLHKLINNKKIEIGKPPTDFKYDDAKYYFIDRTFIRHTNIRMKLSKLERCPDKVLISGSEESFNELCTKYKHSNIHWFEEDGIEFKWLQSHGNVDVLRKYKIGETIIEPNKITDIPDRIVLITAEPGMGKSVILSHLSVMSISSPLWIIRKNLSTYSTTFANWKSDKTFSMSLKTALKFLYDISDFQLFENYTEKEDQKMKQEIIAKVLKVSQNGDLNAEIIINGKKLNTKESSFLEIHLFTHFYNQGKVALLLDGFDEINPDFKNQVIYLLQVLKDKSKLAIIWMTTRPYNIYHELENILGTFSYSITPFSDNKMKQLLKKVWKKKLENKNLNEQETNLRIAELLSTVTKYTSNLTQMHLFTTPLLIYMIAEYFMDDFKTPDDSNYTREKLDDDFDLVLALYDSFIEKKFYEEVKKQDPILSTQDVPRVKYANKREFVRSQKIHEKLAVLTLFGREKKLLEKLCTPKKLKKMESLKNNVGEVREKSGIVNGIVNGSPEFIHLTFAEYFTANWIWKKIESTNLDEFKNFEILIRNLLDKGFSVVCAFLNSLAKKNPDGEKICHKEYKFSSIITIIFHYINDEKSHDYNTLTDTETEIQVPKTFVKNLCGVIEYSVATNEACNLRILKNFTDPNKPYGLLLLCAKMGYTKCASALSQIDNMDTKYLKSKHENNNRESNPLWIAFDRGHLDIVKILIEKFSYDLSWRGTMGDFFDEILWSFPHSKNILRNLLKSIALHGHLYNNHDDIERCTVLVEQTLGVLSDVIKSSTTLDKFEVVNDFPHFQQLKNFCLEYSNGYDENADLEFYNEHDETIGNNVNLIRAYRNFFCTENYGQFEFDAIAALVVFGKWFSLEELRRDIFRNYYSIRHDYTTTLDNLKETDDPMYPQLEYSETSLFKSEESSLKSEISCAFDEFITAHMLWQTFKSNVQNHEYMNVFCKVIAKILEEPDLSQFSQFLYLLAKEGSYFQCTKMLYSFEEGCTNGAAFENLCPSSRLLLQQFALNSTNPIGKEFSRNPLAPHKLLLGIFECYNDISAKIISFGINTSEQGTMEYMNANKQYNLLLICAEMGYTKFTYALSLTNKLDIQFLQDKLETWHDSPLWLAAEHGFLDVMRVLTEKFSYNISWKDKNENRTLIQAICIKLPSVFHILESCLKSGVLDCNPCILTSQTEREHIFKTTVFSNVIESLLYKMDFDALKIYLDWNPLQYVYPKILKCLPYTEQLTPLISRKNIDFSDYYEGINFLILSFIEVTLKYSAYKLEDNFTQLQLKYLASKFKDLYRIPKVGNLFSKIQFLLRCGVGYNYKFRKTITDIFSSEWFRFHQDSQSRIPSVEQIHKLTTLQYVKQICDIFELFNKVLGLLREENNEMSTPKVYTILQLIISDIILSTDPTFNGYEIAQKSNEITLTPSYQPIKQHNLTAISLYCTQHCAKEDGTNENLTQEISVFVEEIEKLQKDRLVHTSDDILKALKTNVHKDEELQKLKSRIKECGSIQFLPYEVWSDISHFLKEPEEVLKDISTFYSEFQQIFKLLEKLDVSYQRLIKAIKTKNHKVIETLLQKNSDFKKAIMNGQDEKYGSPLHFAVWKNDSKAINILLEHGANPNLQLSETCELLLLCARSQNQPINCECTHKTPLEMACSLGHTTICTLLLKKGATAGITSAYKNC